MIRWLMLLTMILIVLAAAESRPEAIWSYYKVSCMSDLSIMSLDTEVIIYPEFAIAVGKQALAKKYNLYPLDSVSRNHKCQFKSGQTYIIKYGGDRFFSVSTDARKILEFFGPGISERASAIKEKSIRIDRVKAYVDLITVCGLVQEETSRCESFHYDDRSIKLGYSKMPADPSTPLDLKLLFLQKTDHNPLKDDVDRPRPKSN